MEYWDVTDETGRKIAPPVPKGSIYAPGTYHLAVELWLINPAGEVLLQKRAPGCEIMPGLWALTTGRVQAGEDSAAGCIREAREELGLALSPKQLIPIYRVARPEERMIWQVYLAWYEVHEQDMRLQKEEVAAVRWAKIADLLRMAKRGQAVFYPELPQVADLVCRHYQAGTGRG